MLPKQRKIYPGEDAATSEVESHCSRDLTNIEKASDVKVGSSKTTFST